MPSALRIFGAGEEERGKAIPRFHAPLVPERQRRGSLSPAPHGPPDQGSGASDKPQTSQNSHKCAGLSSRDQRPSVPGPEPISATRRTWTQPCADGRGPELPPCHPCPKVPAPRPSRPPAQGVPLRPDPALPARCSAAVSPAPDRTWIPVCRWVWAEITRTGVIRAPRTEPWESWEGAASQPSAPKTQWRGEPQAGGTHPHPCGSARAHRTRPTGVSPQPEQDETPCPAHLRPLRDPLLTQAQPPAQGRLRGWAAPRPRPPPCAGGGPSMGWRRSPANPRESSWNWGGSGGAGGCGAPGDAASRPCCPARPAAGGA